MVHVGVENSKVAAWFSEMLVVTPPGTTSIALIPRGFHYIARPSEMTWRAVMAMQYDCSNGKHPLARKLGVKCVAP
jgi:hypothetical protein